MKKAHFLGLGLLGLALVGPAQATPILTGFFEAENQGVILEGVGNGKKNGQQSLFVFAHDLNGEEPDAATISGGTIKLRFKGEHQNWTQGRFNLQVGGHLVAEKIQFAEFIEITFELALTSETERFNPNVRIQRTNAAGSATFTGSELKLWGSGITPSAANTAEATADATPVPAPGTLFLLAAGLLAATAFLRRRLR